MRAVRALVLAGACALCAALVGAPAPHSDRALAGVHRAASRAADVPRVSAGAFAVDDPLAPEQWYLSRTRVFDAWPELPLLAPVRVAIIDSGVDEGHPELAGRIVAARSFVGGSVGDLQGHGTIVAGIIAARLGNGAGIAGLAPSAELLIAKVVDDSRSISVRAEAQAIRWAVDNGARVINMSLGGMRDPRNARRDTYSAAEADAIAYAVRKGVLIVAAVGNGDQAPREPWPYATYPAALPHVVGVSAIGRAGGSPAFSNRDQLYNDVAAPGVAILSIFPRVLTAERVDCLEQGYTLCASDEFSEPEGTSFAAPQVTAIAANLLAVRPDLRPEQIAAIIQRTASDARPATGCAACVRGRDALTGWGEVDGAAALGALAGPLPAADTLEPNDDAGASAARLYFPPGTASRGVRATLDYWDDRDDVYAVRLLRGEQLFASFAAAGVETEFALWAPDALSITDPEQRAHRVRRARTPAAVERLAYTAIHDGWHFLQLRLVAPVGPVPYRLSVVRRAR